MRTPVLSLFLALATATSSFANGDHPPPPRPQDPVEQARTHLAVLQAFSITTMATKVNLPVPRILVEPIQLTEPGSPLTVEVRIRKLGFRNVMFSGTAEPVTKNGHPVFETTMDIGELDIEITLRAAGLVSVPATVRILDLRVPVDVHALAEGTKMEVKPADRQNDVSVGGVRVDIPNVPNPIERLVMSGFEQQAKEQVATGVAHAVYALPTL